MKVRQDGRGRRSSASTASQVVHREQELSELPALGLGLPRINHVGPDVTTGLDITDSIHACMHAERRVGGGSPPFAFFQAISLFLSLSIFLIENGEHMNCKATSFAFLL